MASQTFLRRATFAAMTLLCRKLVNRHHRSHSRGTKAFVSILIAMAGGWPSGLISVIRQPSPSYRIAVRRTRRSRVSCGSKTGHPGLRPSGVNASQLSVTFRILRSPFSCAVRILIVVSVSVLVTGEIRGRVALFNRSVACNCFYRALGYGYLRSSAEVLRPCAGVRA
jgi:hypothetical protein